jgi:hypothetical protein
MLGTMPPINSPSSPRFKVEFLNLKLHTAETRDPHARFAILQLPAP